MILESPGLFSLIALALSLVLFIAWQFTRFRIRAYVSKSKAPSVPYYLPFGLDTMYQIVKVIFSHLHVLTSSTTTEMVTLSS